MIEATIDITEARRQLPQLEQRLRQDQVIWVMRRGKKAFAVVDTEMLQTVLETIEIMSDPGAFEMLQQSLQDIRAGRLHDHADVKRELLS